MIRVRALLNKIDLASPEEVNNYQKQAISILKLLPNSQTKAFTLINLANTAAQLDNFQFQAETLNLALQTAKSINDQRTVSFALGALGHLYEKQNRLQEALRVTQQAQLAAQAVNSIDSLYRWEWQAARIYKQQGAKADAIVAYKQAVNSLQQIRNDIAVTNQDFQFDFRDEVEPVYRELMELLLENGSLPEVLQLSELLKLTEVQNYFQDECSQIKTAIDSVNAVFIHSNEAIITSFILKQQSFVVLRLSNGALKSYPIALNAQQMFDNVLSFRYALEDIATNEYLVLSQKLYALLLQPLEADLNQAKTKVNTFVNDGILRNIPMAALYDGKQFLVEKYTIANSLGFNLPRSTSTNTLDRTTIFGLSLASPPLPVLPNVLAEAQAIKDVTAGEEFLNSDFTVSNFKKQVQNGSQVIHVATHGSFGLSAQTTYLQAYDRRIILKELDTIFAQRQEPIELLTLSACETASGDSRATLGLAGIAARNGVKNVLASLWFVNDIAVLPLMEDFYTLIAHSNYSKAQALQAAQIKLIQNQIHPSVWAAFILLHS